MSFTVIWILEAVCVCVCVHYPVLHKTSFLACRLWTRTYRGTPAPVATETPCCLHTGVVATEKDVRSWVTSTFQNVKHKAHKHTVDKPN